MQGSFSLQGNTGFLKSVAVFAPEARVQGNNYSSCVFLLVSNHSAPFYAELSIYEWQWLLQISNPWPYLLFYIFNGFPPAKSSSSSPTLKVRCDHKALLSEQILNLHLMKHIAKCTAVFQPIPHRIKSFLFQLCQLVTFTISIPSGIEALLLMG